MDVGVIVVGTMGKNHVRLYSEAKKVNNLFVYDLNHKAAHNIAIQHGATSCESVAELLNVVDAVSVCVPTQYHVFDKIFFSFACKIFLGFLACHWAFFCQSTPLQVL